MACRSPHDNGKVSVQGYSVVVLLYHSILKVSIVTPFYLLTATQNLSFEKHQNHIDGNNEKQKNFIASIKHQIKNRQFETTEKECKIGQKSRDLKWENSKRSGSEFS